LSGGTRTQRSDAAKGVGWKLLLMRNKFQVTELSKAEGLTLSVAYKGGIVVYLNGEEIARSDMPEGELGPYTPAAPYDKAVWMRSDGHGMKGSGYRRYLKKIESDSSAPRRVRKMTGFKIPADKLRKGRNVLAISIHRPPARWQLYATREKAYPLPTSAYPRLAFHSVDLVAPAGAEGVSGPADKTTPGPLRAWNYSVARRVFTSFYRSAAVEQLRPIGIVGCRNGVFSGQLVLGCAKGIKGLKVQVSDLTGPGTIPAKAVAVRYGLPDGWVNQGWMMSVRGPWFDGLEEHPPAVAPVYKDGGGATQPVWFKVTVPKDAKGGDYKATVKITADGADPIQAQIELKVLDWVLAAPKDFILDMDYFQSPDTLAMKYKVPFWSKRHWELIEKSFTEMERFAGKTVYITCIRQTQLGNQHAMVRWVRDEQGKLTPDITLAEKYLDMAAKHQSIKAVVLYVWAPPSSEGEYSAVGITHDREIFISVLDKKTGKLTEEKGPVWGTPASWKFWGKLTLAMKAALEKRGLDDKMMYGLLGDHRATRKAMDDISAAAPKTLWALQSHTYCEEWKGKKLGMCSAFWGIRAEPRDPAIKRGYGWQNPYWLTYGPRDSTRTVSQIARFRTLPELWITASATSASRWKKAVGVRGLSRLGIDFWRVLDKRVSDFGGLTIIGRYPETEWGHLSFARGTPALLRPG
ncbi:hypothetical protein LCGC14_2082890, partial [marine sediment metagenome]